MDEPDPLSIELPVPLSIEPPITEPSLSPDTKPDENDYNNEEEQGEDDDSEDEELEEEEVATEMTSDEKKIIFEAVKIGDIDALEDCLDKPNSDINIIWYKENLLMSAIRHNQEKMAEFLLDNGVDHTYSTSVMEKVDTHRGVMLDRYDLNCRQMAYDHGLLNIVQLIDLLEGNVFRFVHPPERTPRYRRQNPPTASELEDRRSSDISSDDSSTSSGSWSDQEGSIKSDTGKGEKKKRRKGDDEVNENDNDKNNDDNTLVLHVDKNEEERSVRDTTKRRRERKKKRENNSIKKEDEELDNNKEITNRIDVDSRHHKVSSDLLADDVPNKYLATRSFLSFKGIQSHPQEIVAEVIQKSSTVNKRHVNDGNNQTDTDSKPLSMKENVSPSLSELKRSWLTQPTNRIWFSKSALAIRKAFNYKCPAEDYLQRDSLNKPLRWKKVCSIGSYSKESRQWHKETTLKLGSSGEVAGFEHTPSSFVHLPSIDSTKVHPYMPACIPKPTNTPSLVLNVAITSTVPPSNNNNLLTQTTIHMNKIRQRNYNISKQKIIPKFMSSYAAMEFFPSSRAARIPLHSTPSNLNIESQFLSSDNSHTRLIANLAQGAHNKKITKSSK